MNLHQKNSLALLFLITCWSAVMANEVYIGMEIDQFKQIFPKVIPDYVEFNRTFEKSEKIHGFNGKWTFDCKKNRLMRVHYKYTSNITIEEEFATTLQNIHDLVDSYSQKYGSPILYNEIDTVYKKRDYSFHQQNNFKKYYELLAVHWETAHMKINFTFDYRSNYYKSRRGSAINAPPEYYYYQLFIRYRKKRTKEKIAHQEKFYIGMPVEAFAQQFPEFFPRGVQISGQWSREQKLYDLDGTWHYTFENGLLEWYSYSFYHTKAEEVNESNFNKCLKATESLVQEYRNKYAKPESYKSDKSYSPPLRILRKNVIEAKWVTDKIKCKVAFDYWGGRKGSGYSYSVTIKFFASDYPYFD